MNDVSGGTLPAAIFREFMRDTHEFLHFKPKRLP